MITRTDDMHNSCARAASITRYPAITCCEASRAREAPHPAQAATQTALATGTSLPYPRSDRAAPFRRASTSTGEKASPPSGTMHCTVAAALAALIAVLVGTTTGSTTARDSRPNFVFVLADVSPKSNHAPPVALSGLASDACRLGGRTILPHVI